jgi:integrase/recombinase XerC
MAAPQAVRDDAVMVDERIRRVTLGLLGLRKLNRSDLARPLGLSRVLVVPRVPRGLPRPVSERDLERALAAAGLLLRVWIELAAYGGLRAGEIARLERADVLDEVDSPTLLLRGKGGKSRAVPLADSTLADLHALGMPSRGRIFHRADGRPATGRSVGGTVNRHLHALGIPCTIHQLRHRFATCFYRTTRDLRVLQELMGHQSPATTAVYTLVDPSAAAPAVNAIARPLLRPVRENPAS